MKKLSNNTAAVFLSPHVERINSIFDFYTQLFSSVTADWLSICSLTKTIDLKLIGACSRNCSWWKSLSTDNFAAFRKGGGEGSFVFSLRNNLVNYVLSSNHKPLILFCYSNFIDELFCSFYEFFYEWIFDEFFSEN